MSQFSSDTFSAPVGGTFKVKVTAWKDFSGKALGGGSGDVDVTLGNGWAVFAGQIPKSGFLSAKRDKPIQKRIALSEIVDVTIGGKVVAFDLYQQGTLYSRCTLLANSEEEAQRFAANLPTTKLPGFLEEMQKSETFVRELVQDTPTLWVFPTIIALNILAFIVAGLMGAGWGQANTEVMLRIGADQWAYTTGGQWWRLLTSAFLHFGVIHLLANMYALLFIGPLAERLFGNLYMALIYLFSAVLSGLASVWWEPHAVSAGASGAVFAMYGAVIAYVALQKSSFPKATAQALAQSALVCVGYNVIYGLSQQGISNAAHLGGLASGLVLGAIMSRPVDREKRRSQFALKLAMGVIVGIGAIGVVVAKVPKSGMDVSMELAFDAAQDVVMKEQKFAMPRAEALLKEADAKPDQMKESAARLRSEIVPAWDRAYKAMAAAEVPVKSPSREIWELFMEYTRDRRDGTLALAEFLETNNPKKEAEYNVLLDHGNTAVDRINKLVEKKGN